MPGIVLAISGSHATRGYAENMQFREAYPNLKSLEKRLTLFPTTRRKFIRLAATAGVAALAADTTICSSRTVLASCARRLRSVAGPHASMVSPSLCSATFITTRISLSIRCIQQLA